MIGGGDAPWVARRAPREWATAALSDANGQLVLRRLPPVAGSDPAVGAAPVVKAGEHRLDGVLLPPEDDPELPVVFLEVQMFPDPLFFHRLVAEATRYLLQHPQVMDWQAVVIVPEAGIQLGPSEPFRELLERRMSLPKEFRFSGDCRSSGRQL